jgi:hypothetical protein
VWELRASVVSLCDAAAHTCVGVCGCGQVIDQSTQTNPHLSPSLPPSPLPTPYSFSLLLIPFPHAGVLLHFLPPNRGVPWCLGDPPRRLPLLLFLRPLPCAFYQFAKMDTVRTTIVGDNMPLRLGGAERPHVLEWIKARLSQDEGVWGKVKVIAE